MLTVDSFVIWEASSRDTIDFKKIYVDVADGDFMAGFGLSELIYWILPNKRGESKLRIEREGKKWIRISYDEWLDRTGIKEDAVRRIYKVLKELDLIEVKLFRFNGSPSVHVWVDVGVLVARLNSVMARMESGKSPESNPVNPQNPIRVNTGFQSGESQEFLTETLTKTLTETTSSKSIGAATPPGARQPETIPLPFAEDKPAPKPKRTPKPKDPTKPKHDPDGFEQLCQQYPGTIDPAKSARAWDKLKPSEELKATIFHYVLERKGSGDWATQDPAYITHLHTFLRDYGWLVKWVKPSPQQRTGSAKTVQDDQAEIARFQYYQNLFSEGAGA